MTYEIENGWIHGNLPGLDGELIPVRHFPQGPYERRRNDHPNLCLHTTETDAYVEHLLYPSEFQVGEGIIGQHRPIWARGAAVDTRDHDLVQIEIVGRSKLDVWLPGPLSLRPLVALMAFLHKRDIVRTAVARPTSYERWPVQLDRLPAAVDWYYRRREVWPTGGAYGHVEIPDDEHWDPGSIDYPRLFAMVRDVIDRRTDQGDGDVLTDEQLDGIRFSNGMKQYLDTPNNEPDEPGPKRQGFRFARRVSEHLEAADVPALASRPIEGTPDASQMEPEPDPPPEDASTTPEHHPGPEEEQAQS
jgi:hypothetical protein